MKRSALNETVLRGRRRRAAFIAIVSWLATCGGVLLADEPAGKGNQAASNSAVAQARAGVFQVECTDPRDANSTIVFSAVAIDREGHLVTVGLRSPGERNLCVRDCAAKRFDARWLGADDQTGLAVLKVDSEFSAVPRVREEPPELGSRVFVVGNPFGLSHSVSVGNISGLDRRVSVAGWTGRGLIQFTAPIFPGDSGGLVADQDGKMLGVVCTALGQPNLDSFFGERHVTGIGFAIPAADVHLVTQRLRSGKKVERGYLGVTGEVAEKGGVRVTRVAAGSPAEAAGLQVADVIAAINGVALRDFDDLALRLDRSQPGDELKLTVIRDGAETSASAAVVARKAPAAAPNLVGSLNASDPFATLWARDVFGRNWRGTRDMDGGSLGVQTQAVTERLAKSLGLASTEGALISSVLDGSPADLAGLRPSDLIVLLDQQPVKSPRELDERIRAAAPRGNVGIAVLRSGRTESIVVKIGDKSVADSGDLSVLRFMPRSNSIDKGGRTSESIDERVRFLEQRIEELERSLREKTETSPTTPKN